MIYLFIQVLPKCTKVKSLLLIMLHSISISSVRTNDPVFSMNVFDVTIDDEVVTPL